MLTRHALFIAVLAWGVLYTQAMAVPLLLEQWGQIHGVPDNPYAMRFAFYEQESGGSPLWTEGHDGIAVEGGIYRVELGELTSLNPSLFGRDVLYLETAIETDQEGWRVLPRQRITPVAFALQARDAERLDGKSASDFAQSEHMHNLGELNGRVRDAQVPDDITVRHAQTAGDADTVDGRQASDFAQHDHTHELGLLGGVLTDTQIPDDVTIDRATEAGNALRLGGHPVEDFALAAQLFTQDAADERFVNVTGDVMEATTARGGAVLAINNSGKGYGLRVDHEGNYTVVVGGSNTGVSSTVKVGAAVAGLSRNTLVGWGGSFASNGQFGTGVFAHAGGEYGVAVAGQAHSQGATGTSTGASLSAIGGGAVGGHFHAFGREYGGIGVKSSGNLYDFYAVGRAGKFAPFTGAHQVKLAGDFPLNYVEPGMLVSATGITERRRGETWDTVNVSSTLPTVRLAMAPRDKACLGAWVAEDRSFDAVNERTQDPLGRRPTHWYRPQAGERFGIVNALGEGRIWVTTINGPPRVGDYITPSFIPGFGQRQEDDVLHSYTVGKVIEGVDWDNVMPKKEWGGKWYKKYLIAVVFTSG